MVRDFRTVFELVNRYVIFVVFFGSIVGVIWNLLFGDSGLLQKILWDN